MSLSDLSASDESDLRMACDRLDPVAATSWTIATYPMDYHRIHFYHVNHEPCVVPIVVAHQYVQCWLEDNISENDYVKYGTQQGRRINGCDG